MFRELVRKKQALAMEECKVLLLHENRGILSVNGDDGYPYGMPMNHYYDGKEGCLYFHQGKVGHRLDSLKRDNKVSYCVMDNGERKDGEWAYVVKSVVIFGKIEIIEDLDKIKEISYKLSKKFTSDENYILEEISKYEKNTLLLKLVIEHISGKRVKEE